MHRAAIVPDDEVVQAPGVTVNELRERRACGQIAQHDAAFGDRPIDDVTRVGGEVERRATGAGVDAYQRLYGAGELRALRVGEVGEADRLARVEDGVEDLQVGDLRAALKSATGVSRVEILLPIASLTRVEILDTPGFNAPDPDHTRVARSAFEEADVAVWLLDATQAMKRGVQVHLHTAVTAIEPVQGGYVVRTARGSVRATASDDTPGLIAARAPSIHSRACLYASTWAAVAEPTPKVR